MARALLYDSTLCVGCRQCESACSTRWKLPYDDKIAAEEKTSAHKLTTIRTYGERFSRKLCMHCQDPACASVCPVAALRKTAAGPVVYEADRCMGCRYCMAACPFQVPSYEWNARLPLVRKCDFCSDRVPTNGPTRCSEECPTGASITGERSQLIAEAKKRIAEKPTEYYQKIYGIEEVGGTSVLVLSAVPFEQIGYNTKVEKSALPQYTWNALQHIPDVVVMGTVLMGGVYWISHRKEQVAKEEGRQ
ncbi:MAG: 4Fe-4S dicluster domain-containing protein [Acidobacteria bacterium]|nr:4Fe-4S dicluster domain-containing protein [Acidobacteriota bacterium]